MRLIKTGLVHLCYLFLFLHGCAGQLCAPVHSLLSWPFPCDRGRASEHGVSSQILGYFLERTDCRVRGCQRPISSFDERPSTTTNSTTANQTTTNQTTTNQTTTTNPTRRREQFIDPRYLSEGNPQPQINDHPSPDTSRSSNYHGSSAYPPLPDLGPDPLQQLQTPSFLQPDTRTSSGPPSSTTSNVTVLPHHPPESLNRPTLVYVFLPPSS